MHAYTCTRVYLLSCEQCFNLTLSICVLPSYDRWPVWIYHTNTFIFIFLPNYYLFLVFGLKSIECHSSFPSEILMAANVRSWSTTEEPQKFCYVLFRYWQQGWFTINLWSRIHWVNLRMKLLLHSFNICVDTMLGSTVLPIWNADMRVTAMDMGHVCLQTNSCDISLTQQVCGGAHTRHVNRQL